MREGRERLEREATEERSRLLEKIAREDRDVTALIGRDPIAGYTALIEALARRNQITVNWVDALPPGVAGTSSEQERRIQAYPIGRIESPETSAAVALHEIWPPRGWRLLAGR